LELLTVVEGIAGFDTADGEHPANPKI